MAEGGGVGKDMREVLDENSSARAHGQVNVALWPGPKGAELHLTST